VPEPVLARLPEPPIALLSVSSVPPVSIWKAPVPPVPRVNGLVLLAVAPVYSKVPVAPELPSTTAVALLPRGPGALALVIVGMASVPPNTLSVPVNVFVPLKVCVFVPVF
jgi:hypothetical protein